MERTEYTGGAVRVCGSGTIYRVLNFLSGYLLGAQGMMDAPRQRSGSWWEDIDIGGQGDRHDDRFQQAEFWGVPEQKKAAPEASKPIERNLESPVVAAPVRAARSARKSHPRMSKVTVNVYAEKKKNMSIMRIARFLNISESLYDGRDRGRWYNLPLRRGSIPYQLTNEVTAANHDGRTLRAVPRVFSGISRPRENGYLMK